MNKTSPQSAARQCVENLVTHYNQPIHNEPHLSLSAADSEADSPFLDHLSGKLIQSTRNSRSDIVQTVSELLDSYKVLVRPVLFIDSTLAPNGAACLVHYRILLTRYYKHIRSREYRDDSTTASPDYTKIVQGALHTINSDIILASTLTDKNNTISADIIIPTLLQLVNVLFLLTRFIETHDSILIIPTVIKTFTILLAFTLPLGPDNIDQTINNVLDDVSKYVLPILKPLDDTTDLTCQSFNWTQDCVVSSNFQTAASIKYASQACESMLSLLDVQNTDNKDPYNILLHHFGCKRVAASAHAHFLGHDYQTRAPRMVDTMHLGQTVTYNADGNDKVFEGETIRIHAALHFVSLLEDIDGIMNDMLPILHGLLSSHDYKLNSVGAATLYRICQCKNATKIINCSDIKSPLLVILNLLESNAKACHNGQTLALLSLAQNSVFAILATDSLHHRRMALQSYLGILRRHAGSATKNDLILGVLRGGLLPVLRLFVINQQKGNDPVIAAMEAGRLGLSALLPLITIHDSEQVYADDVVTCALLALQLLFVAACPTRHGGKIVASCLTCAVATTQQLAIRVGAMAVVIYKPNNNVLSHILVDQRDDYNEKIIHAAQEMQNFVDKLESDNNNKC